MVWTGCHGGGGSGVSWRLLARQHLPGVSAGCGIGTDTKLLATVCRIARSEEDPLELDEDKLDMTALAILRLTLHNGQRVWKSIDWAITDRLYDKGLIENPAGKAKSLVLTDKGLAEAQATLTEMFGKT
jgi:hypothetical protein